MTTLTIKIPDDAKIKLSAIVKELGGEIVQVNKKLSKTPQQKEAELLSQIESGLRDVADIKSGKIKRVTLSEDLSKRASLRGTKQSLRRTNGLAELLGIV